MKKRQSTLRLFWKQRQAQAFALSGMAYLFVFSIIPMIGLVIAFKDYQIEDAGFMGLLTAKWVGLKFFREFFSEYNFSQLLRNTLCISLLKLVFSFPLPILFALMLNEIHSRGAKRVLQTVSYMPYFISWVVVFGFCQLFLNSQTGVVNQFMVSTGLWEKPFNFLANPSTFWPIAVLTGIWKEMGWWTIIFLAAITGVSPALYEAATIDGANRIQRICHVTLPSILPTVSVVLILALGNLMGGGMGGSNFDQSYLMGNLGNRETSDILQTYVYRVGMAEGRYSYATAAGMFQSVISVILVTTSNWFSKKVTGNGLY